MRVARPLQILVAAGALLGLAHVLIHVFIEPSDRFYQFLYERGPVQHAIALVACLVAAMLLDRLSQYRWNRVQFKALEMEQGPAPEELASQLEAVHGTHEKYGESAAAIRAEKIALSHGERIDKAHETIGYVASSLPALGLFGTMLGLSSALFVAFGGSVGTDQSVRMFVSGLATAMDTTVLAMACAVPLFGCAWLIRRCEHNLAEQYAAYVRNDFGLDEAAVGDKTVHALRAELRRLTDQIGEQATTAFEQVLIDSANTYRKHLQRAVQAVFSLQRRHDKDLVNKVAAEVAAGLGQSVHHVGDLLVQHNGRLAESMIQRVGQLEEALRNRTPEEVVIRYQHNGHVSGR